MEQYISEFANKINSITEVTASEFSDAVLKAQTTPIPENLWILSRMITIAPNEIIKSNIDKIIKATSQERSKQVSACFASSHFLRRADEIGCADAHKWIRKMPFPNNPLYASYVYNIMSKPAFGNNLPILYELLKLPHKVIQDHAAAAIARAAKSPANYLRRILATLSNEAPPDVKKLEISEITPSLKYGLLMVAKCLTTNFINATEYSRPLLHILSQVPSTKQEIETAKCAQELLAKMLVVKPSAFHTVNVYSAASIQDRAGNLLPVFLSAMLSCFGLACVRKFVSHIVKDRWLGKARASLPLFAIIAPYAAFLETPLQIEIHSTLIGLLERRPYDRELIKIIGDFMNAASPAQSPLFSRFIEIVKRSFGKDIGLAEIRGLTMPKVSPIPHPHRPEMVIPQIETRDAYVQVDVPKRNIIIQCDAMRDIKPISQPKPQYRPTYISKKTIVSTEETKTALETKQTIVKKEESESDDEGGIALDFGDSSDE